MNKQIYLLAAFTLLILTGGHPTAGRAQSLRRATKQCLAVVAQRLQDGVYERTIDLGYISSPERYDPKAPPPTAHNEYTMVFLRFDAMEPVGDSSQYVGKVFMSERYLELHYNKAYRSRRAYNDDKDGFFMACKLYFDEQSLEYRLNVYPDYVLNICRKSGRPFKGMHFNSVPCTTMQQHWNSIKYVAALPDKHYGAFSEDDDSLSIRRFLDAPDGINIRANYLSIHEERRQRDSMDFNPTIKQKNLLREINLRKQIKYFTVGSINDCLADSVSPQLAASLKLKYTKYALSDDLLEGAEYAYHHLPDSALVDSTLNQRGRPNVFLTRNPLYRSLMTSELPDDHFIPGIYMDDDVELAITADRQNLPRNLLLGTTSSTHGEDSLTSLVQRGLDKAALEQIKGLPPGQKQQRVEDQLSRNANQEQITITSVDTSDVHWMYAGRFTRGENLSAYGIDSGAVYAARTQQHLRRTPPLYIRETGKWLKGKVKFSVDGGKAAKDSRWLVLARPQRLTVPDDAYEYVWLQVKRHEEPKRKRGTHP